MLFSLIISTGVAYAVPVDNNQYESIMTRLRASYGYTYSYDELDSQITAVSVETGKEKSVVARESLLLSEKYATGYTGDSFERANNSGKHNPLDNAHNQGDVFVSEGNNTFGWNHGHTGIFISSTTVVEAVDPGTPARSIWRGQTGAAGKAFLQSVSTSPANRDKAANRAKTYIGRGYNAYIVGTNRNDWGGLNCSQLVWASYMYGAAIDLAPKDNFVYPYSIRDSRLTSTYKTINV